MGMGLMTHLTIGQQAQADYRAVYYKPWWLRCIIFMFGW